MLLVAAALPVLATVFSAWQVSADEDCLWHVDKNGTWHTGFDCPLISFCCGTCHRRYCCLDPMKMISERQQKRCMFFQFSPTTIAGIASSILLFVAIVATIVCCFMCSCCYLYQRRLRGGPPTKPSTSPWPATRWTPCTTLTANPSGRTPGTPWRLSTTPACPRAPTTRTRRWIPGTAREHLHPTPHPSTPASEGTATRWRRNEG
ncbi:hypothetical protein ANANG_G00242930 [Anguilla anguilla]|uniref:Shisa N-terminal domain-containing protein n=1 Tax=Anguilla anguilla TaxID=7936 RepID=A0A9D3RLZ5_ANGAN|nr:hypothetical protein ANANG_G00242930 [Anguilla anguilla]